MHVSDFREMCGYELASQAHPQAQEVVVRAILPTTVWRCRGAIGLAVLESARVQLECGGAFPL